MFLSTSTAASCRRLLLGLWFLMASGAFAAPGPGDLPPDEVGRTLGGEPVLLSAHAGKAIVVSYWATWCPYCLKELPILQGIQRSAGPEHMQVIAVNTEDRDVFRGAERALRPLGLLMAYDPGKASRKAFGVGAIPHMVIIGKDGRIIRVYTGYSESSLDSIVADINRAIGALPN